MKQFIAFIFSILLSLNFATAQEQQGKNQVKYTNPFEQAGIKGIKILTLSNGKYQEFHDLDSVVQIGTTLINVNSRKIVGFVKKDSANSMPDASVSSRWISVDPLAEHTYNLTPYNFGYNNPIYWNDPDGRCPICPYLAGAIGGAALDYGIQVATNLYEGKGASSFVDIDGTSILISAGAAGVGLVKNGGKLIQIIKGGNKVDDAAKIVDDVAKFGDDLASKTDKIVESAYDIAKNGGTHSGFYKNYLNKTTKELKSGIEKLQKQIDEHTELIKNPAEMMKKLDKGEWEKLDPRQQKALLEKKWPSDIQRQKEQQDILRGLLNEKK